MSIHAPLEWRFTFELMVGPGVLGERFEHLTQPLIAIRSRDYVDAECRDQRWHLSVSHAERVPTWGELGMARDALLPAELHFMIPHPPRRYWLNIDRRVLHLWEVRDPITGFFEWEGENVRKRGLGAPPDSGDPRG